MSNGPSRRGIELACGEVADWLAVAVASAILILELPEILLSIASSTSVKVQARSTLRYLLHIPQ